MRRRHSDPNGLTVNVVSGTHVVFFGLDLAPQVQADFRGFGFQRFDHIEDEKIWLRGMKTFQQTDPHPAKGELYTHYAFREAVKRFIEVKKAKRDTWQPQFLVDDDKWMAPYFDAGDKSGRSARRKYFAGPMAES